MKIMDADPLGVILVKSDSKGDRLLFRYPFDALNQCSENGNSYRPNKNPYSLVISEDLQAPPPQNLNSGSLSSIPDEVLSNLFAVKQELCHAKFELKVNNIRFVGHPTLVQPCPKPGKTENRNIVLIHIVFALRASANHSIVKCYYELSRRLGTALSQEELKSGYVYSQIKTMISAHDDRQEEDDDDINDDENRTVFDIILEQSSLANDLKAVYKNLSISGVVQVRINNKIPVCFCLPQKVHHLHNKALKVDPETIEKCIQRVRPYHGLLLLMEPSKLLEGLILDADLIRIIKVYSPLKSLHILSKEAGLSLSQAFNVARHLVYWGKAIIIYPLCETNVYVAAPNASIHSNSHLVKNFSDQFPSQNLIKIISEFSYPISIRQKMSPINGSIHNDVKIIIWLLQHRLLLQLHTYVYFMPTGKGLSQDVSRSEGGGDVTPSETMSSGDSGTESDDLSSYTNPDAHSSDLGKDLKHLEPSERTAIAEIHSSQEQVKLLVDLIVNGEHHLEEIMYKENIRRSQLLHLLDTFQQVLITCEAEDPALSMFYPHSHS